MKNKEDQDRLFRKQYDEDEIEELSQANISDYMSEEDEEKQADLLSETSLDGKLSLTQL